MKHIFDSIVVKLGMKSTIVPSKLYLSSIYKIIFGYDINWENPKSFNEKLQWLKVYDRRPEYTTMVDKYAVKVFVKERIGEEHIIPTLGVWESPEKIDWNALPNQFVLKCTHDSGGLVICRDKTKFDKEAAIQKIRKSLRRNFYLGGREWPYKNVPRRIIAEKYMEDEYGELRDYKFFCFNGVVKALFIATERQKREEPYFDFFDENFRHLDMRHGHPNAPEPPSKPRCFEQMKEIASSLSKGFPELRVDLYEVNGKVYFGEFTLFHHSGLVHFDPECWDLEFGKLITLPSKQI